MVGQRRVKMARRVLNVGGNSKAIAIPAHYAGWEHVLLDIDPAGKPDVLCDARELKTLPAESFDAIYCSHNLEHFFAHDVPRVLSGFQHVLAADGFAEIRVPDIGALIREVAARDLDLTDVLYDSPAGQVRVRDVFYGFGPQIERTGVDFYAHKTGFSKSTLRQALIDAGFAALAYLPPRPYEMVAIAFRQQPNAEQIGLLRLDRAPPR
jgi:SAM-dependent methyltransferase